MTKTIVLAAAAVTLLAAACQPDEEASLVSGVDLEALDRSTRPQDDFYRFVNGGWLDSTEIPEIYSGYTVYHEVNERVELALRDIIETAADVQGEPGSESQQVGDLYASWMDTEAINTAGLAPVQNELARLQAVDSTSALAEVMAELFRLGVEVPYSATVYPDLKDSGYYTIYFGQAGITMPNRDYYLELENDNFSAARAGLPVYMSKLLARSGMEAEEAEAAAAAIYALETELAKAHWDSVRNRDPKQIYNPVGIDELDELGGKVFTPEARETIGIDELKQVIVEQPSYIRALNEMMTGIPLQTWKNYLRFRFLDSRALHLDDTTAAIRFEYRNRVLFGQQEERPRWKLGIDLVDQLVGEAVGKLYVAEYFPPEAKAKMEELVDNVIATLDESLDELEWMSPDTRAKAKEKLSRFTPKIGYPDEWEDYSALEIRAGDHYGNVMRAKEWLYEEEISKLGEPVDRNEWGMTPQTVNAYYNPAKNEIVFPAARLQPPFFQLNADDAINYGAVGGVIGHEISHGFDDSGSQFDGNGNMVNWWTDEDRAAFEQRTRALVDQFSSFEPVAGMFVNGELTLGENIGDLSGVAMAYRAYIRSLDGEEAPVIDGFTGPQRFFIGYAMSRKGKYQREATVNRLASDPHSPLEYRVNGPYPNIDAFHEAFDTSEGDGMWLSPEERVRIW